MKSFQLHLTNKLLSSSNREFVLDDSVNCNEASDAVQFWLAVSEIKSLMGQYMYQNLSTLALQLLSIPVSNADSERVFSLVRLIKTDYRASLSTETLSALIGCQCCEGVAYPDSLLITAKRCTSVRNMGK